MALLSTPFDSGGYTEEHVRIRGLASVAQEMEDGGTTVQEVAEVFRNQNNLGTFETFDAAAAARKKAEETFRLTAADIERMLTPA